MILFAQKGDCMIKVTYMPSTDRKNPLDTYGGESLGSEAEMTVPYFVEWIKRWVCSDCLKYKSVHTDELIDTETLGDLLDSFCAANLWIEEIGGVSLKYSSKIKTEK